MARDIPKEEVAFGKVVHVQESETRGVDEICVRGWKWGCVEFEEGKICRFSW